MYSEKGRASQLDYDGYIKNDFEAYVLRTLMSNCQDFAKEKSAMEVLLDNLSYKGTSKVELLTSPKYYCELAGDGVEYTWKTMRKYHRSLSLLEMKNTKRKFEACVSSSILHMKRENNHDFQPNIEDTSWLTMNVITRMRVVLSQKPIKR